LNLHCEKIAVSGRKTELTYNLFNSHLAQKASLSKTPSFVDLLPGKLVATSTTFCWIPSEKLQVSDKSEYESNKMNGISLQLIGGVKHRTLSM